MVLKSSNRNRPLSSSKKISCGEIEIEDNSDMFFDIRRVIRSEFVFANQSEPKPTISEKAAQKLKWKTLWKFNDLFASF